MIDWNRFARENFERRAVLLEPAGGPVSIAVDTLWDALLDIATNHGGEGLRVFAGAMRVHDFRLAPQVLPKPIDGDFRGYIERLTRELGTGEVGVVCDSLVRHCPALRVALAARFGGMIEAIGLPAEGFHVDLFAGCYSATPFGVHVDPLSNFMMVLEGERVMHLWEPGAWSNHHKGPSTDYRAALGAAESHRLRPGSLLYWPSRMWHVGESTGVTVSLNLDYLLPVGEMRGHDAVIDDLLAAVRQEMLRRRANPPVPASLMAAQRCGEIEEVPRRYAEAAELLREIASTSAGHLVRRSWTTRVSKGFSTVAITTPPFEQVQFDDETVFAAAPSVPLCWTRSDDRFVCAAGGRTMTLAGRPPVAHLLGLVTSGKAFTRREAVAGHDPATAAAVEEILGDFLRCGALALAATESPVMSQREKSNHEEQEPRPR
jgi:Cupin superfamily protein